MDTLSEAKKLINEMREIRMDLRKSTDELRQTRLDSERRRTERNNKASKSAFAINEDLFLTKTQD
jgi:hypothetical protein